MMLAAGARGRDRRPTRACSSPSCPARRGQVSPRHHVRGRGGRSRDGPGRTDPLLRRRRHVRAAGRAAVAGGRATWWRRRGGRDGASRAAGSRSPTDRPWATASPRSSGSARRSRPTPPGRSAACSRSSPSERPLVVVLEDVHWAEPPMLDLADAVVERVHGPVLFLCLARPELLEQRPTWAAGKPRALTTTLPPLSPEDARRVAELLLGPQAPSSRRRPGLRDRQRGTPCIWSSSRRCSRIRGSSSTVGGWVRMTPTSRSPRPCRRSSPRGSIDSIRLPRLILERASVEGRRFRIAALARARPGPRARKTSSLRSPHSNGKGLVQPEDEAGGRWRFAHALVLEAAYRGLSKELRADLHERLADWMIEEDADQADVDESVARHLERALHLREELGARDERSAALSERAGELFADRGIASLRRARLHHVPRSPRPGGGAPARAIPSPLRSPPEPGRRPRGFGARPRRAEALLTEARRAGARGGLGARCAPRGGPAPVQPDLPLADRGRDRVRRSRGARRRPTCSRRWAMKSVWPRLRLAISYLEYMRGRMPRRSSGLPKRCATRSPPGALGRRPRPPAIWSGSRSWGRSRSIGSRRAPRSCSRPASPISGSVGHALMAAAALAAGDDPGFGEHEGRWRDVVDRHGLAWLAAAHGMEIAFVETSVGKAEAAERRLREAREFLAPIGNVWWHEHGRRIPVRSGRSAGSAARVPPARRRVRGLRPDHRPGDPDPTPTAAREGPPAPRVRPRGGGRREARAQARRAHRPRA